MRRLPPRGAAARLAGALLGLSFHHSLVGGAHPLGAPLSTAAAQNPPRPPRSAALQWRYPWQGAVASLVGRCDCARLVPMSVMNNNKAGGAEVLALHGDALLRLFVLEELGTMRGGTDFSAGFYTKILNKAVSNENLALISAPLLVETGLLNASCLKPLSNHSIGTAVEAAISFLHQYPDPETGSQEALRAIAQHLLRESRTFYNWKGAFFEMNTQGGSLSSILVGGTDHEPLWLGTAKAGGRVVTGAPCNSKVSAESAAAEKFCRAYNPEWLVDRFPDRFTTTARINGVKDGRETWIADVVYEGLTVEGDTKPSKREAMLSAHREIVTMMQRFGLLDDACEWCKES